MTHSREEFKTDVLILSAGGAGLLAAMHLPRVTVVVNGLR